MYSFDFNENVNQKEAVRFNLIVRLYFIKSYWNSLILIDIDAIEKNFVYLVYMVKWIMNSMVIYG